MKKKSTASPVGNTLVKEQEVEERPVPADAARILEEDEEARRIRLAEIKDLVASGRYDVSSTDIAKAILQHTAEADGAASEVEIPSDKRSTKPSTKS